jgi:ecotin
MKIKFSITIFVLLTATMSVRAEDSMKAFPPAEKGMVRYVLQLPEQDDESLFRVELIVGKTVQVDEHNKYIFGGRIEKKTIEGWGFSFYKVSKLGPMAGTLMAIDPNAPKVKRFISLGGEPYIIRYNSRLPIVVYVPDGVEVRYRIWTAQADAKAMEKGVLAAKTVNGKELISKADRTNTARDLTDFGISDIAVQSVQTVDPAGFNTEISKAFFKGESWPRDAILVALKFVGEGFRGNTKIIDARTAPESRETATITVTESGYPDDAVGGERWRMWLTKKANGVWIIDRVLRARLCDRPGRRFYSAGQCP